LPETPRPGFGTLEVVLIGVALTVMAGLGVLAASELGRGGVASEAELRPTASPAPLSVEPVKPEAEPAAPATTGERVSDRWVRDMAARTGIGEVAVQDYAWAVLRIGEQQPSCRLGWSTLAAIGGIESAHGTEGGAHLMPDGRTSQPIVGPALDGTNGYAAIRATADSMPWHGDPAWDHAVGPLQFIPSMWERWQSDGNGDGIKDPGNVFDAAYAAGRYLCASGDLSTGAGWSRAIFSYNHSDDYVRSVLSFANAYASR
jgi:membrane-bound lytic murein transglycosylase B